MFNYKQDDPIRCGLDESGRGPLAGPLVAAIVAFPAGFSFGELFRKHILRDSKRLTRISRDRMLPFIYEYAILTDTVAISVAEIDAHGIGWANRAAFERLIAKHDALEYIVDGNLKFSNLGRRANKVRSIVRADETIDAVAAASILAKTTRDRLMKELAEQHPAYGWDHNAGYGTREHVQALRNYGRTEHHRTQFITTALANQPTLPGLSGENGAPP